MDENYADIYYVDARNGRDHRPPGTGQAVPPAQQVPQSRTVVMQQVPANAVAPAGAKHSDR